MKKEQDIINAKVLANTFLEYAINSKTDVIEVAADNKELIDAAKKFNIVIPSPDLSVLKTNYAESDVVNRNGALLPHDAVVQGLPTLIGKQLNWDHEGAHQICGYIIDAKLEGKMIVIYAVLFKSLFPEEMEKLQERFDNKKLAVSFEIWSKDADGNSVITENDKGERVINPIIFHGCGVLVSGELPACPKAYAKKLIASLNLTNKEEMDNLVFASLVSKNICLGCVKCSTRKETEVENAETVKIGNPGLSMPEDDLVHMQNDYAWTNVEDAKKMTPPQRDALKDEDFACILEAKNDKTGEPVRIKMLPIHDATHVMCSMQRINHQQMKDLMAKYGIAWSLSNEKIMKKAEELQIPMAAADKEPDPEDKNEEFELETSEMTDDQRKEIVDMLTAEFLVGEYADEEDNEEDVLGEDGLPVKDAKKITYKERKNLSDSDFALIQTVTNKKTGKKDKVRRFPIHDEAHVRNALARLPQAKGLSEEEKKSVKARILRKAKALGMKDLLERHQEASVEAPVKEAPVKPEEAAATPQDTVVTPEQAHMEAPAVPVETKPVTLDRTITEETETTVCTYGTDGKVEEKKTHVKVTSIWSDGNKTVEEHDEVETNKYSSDQLNAAVTKAVSEKMAEKDKEIATLKAEVDASKKKVEDKDIEIASLKTPTATRSSIEVGSVETPTRQDNDEWTAAKQKVEDIVARKNQESLF